MGERATIQKKNAADHRGLNDRNGPFFQPKLAVNQPNDVFEQEADAVADKVMRMPDTTDKKFFSPPIVQRKCSHCEEEEKKLQRKRTDESSMLQRKEQSHEPTHIVQQGKEITRSQQPNIIQRQIWVGAASAALCKTHSDQGIYEYFRDHYFSDQPNAKAHLIHYRMNKGVNYKEDVKALFDANPRVRTRISMLIVIQGGVTKGATSGVLAGKGADDGKEPPIRQSDYDSDDWRNANGNIDEVRWKLVGAFDPKGNTTYEITVVDPYTWHPAEDRPTQCIHAAMERLKASGAADYITMGTANVVLPPPASLGGKPDSI